MGDEIKLIHTWCGTPITEMTREELEAAFGQLAVMYERAIKDNINALELRRKL